MIRPIQDCTILNNGLKMPWLGVGIMGKPMAKNLLNARYSVKVYDIVTEPVQELVEAGAFAGKSSKDVAACADVIIMMLPNFPEVKEVV